MLIKKSEDIKASEITDKDVYTSRRLFLRGAALATTALGTGWLYRHFATPSQESAAGEKIADVQTASGATVPAINDAKTSYEDITHYNNFYEFSTDKQAVAPRAKNFITRPWTVEVGGLVHKPKTFDIDELIKIAPLEERVYRHRCVEAWAMAVPWTGFPMKALVDLARPLGSATYVRMETFMDPATAPEQKKFFYPWPYVEGLTMAEAKNELAFLVTGMYGKPVPKQDGAPLRLATPWKYGFKSVKSIVRFEFTDKRPKSYWEALQAAEYGFWANVNPEVPHPRWSQASERVLGTDERKPTLMWNGYGEFVADMYKGLEKERLFV
jgi:sulfoxide reductase catalytic subunit YedY